MKSGQESNQGTPALRFDQVSVDTNTVAAARP